MGKDKQQPRIGDIRKIAEEYFIRHGRRLTFRQALLYYRNNGGQYVPSGSFVKPDDFLPDNAFVKYIDNGIIFQADIPEKSMGRNLFRSASGKMIL